MLTSYSVRCQHTGCNWRGSLLPLGRPEAFQSSIPNVKVVTFQCPECQGFWQARVVGDDVVPLPFEKEAATQA